MKLVAEIKDDAASVVRVQVVNDSGEADCKIVSLMDFIGMMQDSSVSDGRMVRLGRLPRGCYDVAVDPVRQGVFKCTIVLPEGAYPIRYADTDYMIPMPAQVFYFDVLDKKVVESKIYVLKDNLPSDESPLYHYPFGNVHDSGSICWGSNALPAVSNVGELDMLVNLFFGSPTNSDLYKAHERLVNPPEYTVNLRSFYEVLAEKKEFPKELLKETGKTLAGIMLED